MQFTCTLGFEPSPSASLAQCFTCCAVRAPSVPFSALHMCSQKHLLTSRPEGSPRDTGLLGQQLEQVCAELEQLQSSETQLESLVEEIQNESLQRAAHLQDLMDDLERENLQRTAQVEELQAELRRYI